MSRAVAIDPPLRVLHAASEVFPLLKTGGLADVTAALPVVQRGLGHDVRLIVPGLPALLDGVHGPQTVAEFGAGFGAARIRLLRGRMPETGLPVYLVDAPWLYDRTGNPYLDAEGVDWPDNLRRFAALSWVAAHLAWGDADREWRADVLHAHDWHAGLAPAYLRDQPVRRACSVFTVHNLAYQGRFPLASFAGLGLDPGSFDPHGLEFHGDGSCMKAGLVYADRLTTVSPRYAQEIRSAEFGAGLEGVLQASGDRLSGILNGIDDAVWDPRTDPHLPATYSSGRLGGKSRCKAALQAELGLAVDPSAPLFTIVSRLTGQKGTDLVLASVDQLVRLGVQLAVLGTGERSIEQALSEAARTHPERIAVRIRYDEAMAHRQIAGADVIVVPSRFEPCGLTQMYGLRYGTLPLVRRVGGLSDTVTDTEPGSLAAGTATGFVFDAADPAAFQAAAERAVAVFRTPADWRRVVKTAMGRDHSWDASARAYVDLYRALLDDGR